MRVVCDNCGATYRIPDEKLRREVNKATCRKCQNPIIIRRSGGMAVGTDKVEEDPEAATAISDLASLHEKAGMESGSALGLDSSVSPVSMRFQPAMGVDEEPVNPTVASSDVLIQARLAEPTIPRQDVGPLDLSHPPPPMPDLPPPVMLPKEGDPRPPMQLLHDPTADMSVVMMTNFAAVFGVLLLAVATQDWQRYGGLLVTLWGVTSSLMVVITSNRGRRQGQVVLSLFVGLLVSGMLSWGFYWSNANLRETSPVVAVPPPVTSSKVNEPPRWWKEEGEADDQVGEGDDLKVGDLDQIGAGEATAVTGERASPPGAATTREAPASSRSQSTASTSRTYPSGSGASVVAEKSGSGRDLNSSSGSARSGEAGSSAASSGGSASGRASDRSSSSAAASAGVPLTVLDTMLRTNRGVRVCFAEYREETGAMPSGRIPVKIRIRPSGSADKVSISSGTYRGTSLDSCLSSAIKQIGFPPFEGEAKNYTYPFSL